MTIPFRASKQCSRRKNMAKYLIIAPGRGGAEWLQTEAQIRGLKTVNNPVDIGVRVEFLAVRNGETNKSSL